MILRRFFSLIFVFVVTFGAAKAVLLQENRSIEAASVVAVQATRIADVVLLGAGFNAGLRQGMVLSVTRAGVVIGEVILVDLRPRASAALITKLNSGQSIRSGDVAAVKILKV